MSTTVDNKIVNMQFNNEKFNAGIQSTLSHITNLRNSLQFKGTTNALAKMDMSPVGSAVDGLTKKFSALEVVGVTALANIANSAINKGKQILSSLTIDPIKTGLEEYETKMNAITTILTNTRSKGTTLSDVNAALAELNTYADKTIYNFANMTKNIGTFTAAGLDLKTSVGAIKGIANLGAGSGSTPEQVARGMYQLSQALSEGRMSLESWNSVTDAGMGGELFQRALVDKAVEFGTLESEIGDSIKNGLIPFREALKATATTPPTLRVTKDILASVFNDFANDPNLQKAATEVKTLTGLLGTMAESVQSGWAQTWEAIIGNKAEATKMFTMVNDWFGNLIGPSVKARNAMWQFWNDFGGRSRIIQATMNFVKGFSILLKPLKDALGKVFPPMTGKKLVEISNRIYDISVGFEKFATAITSGKTNDLSKTFQGLASVFRIVGKVAKFAFDVIKMGVSFLLPIVLKLTGIIGNMITWVDKLLTKTNVFNNITKLLKKILDDIDNYTTKVKNNIAGIGKTKTSGIVKLFDNLKAMFQPLKGFGNDLEQFFKNAFKSISDFNDQIGKIIDSLKNRFKIFEKIGNVFKKVGKVIDDIVDGIKSWFGGLNKVDSYDVMNAGFMTLIGAGIFKIVQLFDNLSDSTKEFTDMLKGIKKVTSQASEVLDSVRGSLEAFQSNLRAKTILTIAIAIGILAVSVALLTKLDQKKLATSLAAMTGLITDLFASMFVYSKFIDGDGMGTIIKSATAMVILSVGILLLVSALRQLAKIKGDDITKGMLTITGMIALYISSSILLTKFGGNIMGAAGGIVLMSMAILLLVGVVKKLAKMDIKKTFKGIGLLVTILGILIGTAVLLSKFSGNILTATGGIVLLAIAINMLLIPLVALGAIPVKIIAKGMAALSGLLLLLTVFTKFTGGGASMIGTGAGLVIISAAISGLVVSITALGLIPQKVYKQGIKGLTMILGLTTLLMAASKVLNPMKLVIFGAGLTAIAVGLTILMVPLTTLSLLPFPALLASLAFLAGLFLTLGVAATVLTPLVPVLFGLAGSIALLGLGTLALAVGLTILATSSIAISASLILIGRNVVKMVEVIIIGIANGLINILGVIASRSTEIKDGFVAIIKMVVDAFVEGTPLVVEGFMKMILSLLVAGNKYLPKFLKLGWNILFSILTSIRDNLPRVVQLVVDIVTTFINALAKEIPRVINAGFKFIVAFVNGIAEAIRTNGQSLWNAVMNVISAIIEVAGKVINKSLKDFKKLGKLLMESGFIQGILDKVEGIVKPIEKLLKKGKDTIVGFVDKFVQAGKDIVAGVGKGITDNAKKVTGALSDLGDGALKSFKKVLGIKSPSREFKKLGKYCIQGLVGGLSNLKEVTFISSKVAKTALDTVKRALSDVTTVINDNLNLTPVITPILDTTNLQNGSKKFDSLIAIKRSMRDTSAQIQSRIAGKEIANVKTVNYVQNNYSPKPLDRRTIYRQTNNLIREVAL